MLPPARLAALLRAALDVPVAIAEVEHIEPWAVCRVRLDGHGGTGIRSVVVKWLRDHPAGFRTDPRQVANERAALEFVADLGLDLAPRLLGADPAAEVLVLEDLSPRIALDSLIRRDGLTRAQEHLAAFAHATGTLNAATAGRAPRFDALRARYGGFAPATDRRDVLGPNWPTTRRLLDELGGGMSGAEESDLALLRRTLETPGPFTSLTNGDPESNNFLVDPDHPRTGRIIDFEFAGYRHAATSATWIHVPGPGWLTVANPEAVKLEQIYRNALSNGVREALDDRQFGLGMGAACLAMAFGRSNRLPVLDARAPGDPSRPQLISTLESAADAAASHRTLPRLVGWTRRVADLLRKRWSDADVDFRAYPGYTVRG
ncbi:MAG TPA: hypothetical protein VI076_06330 [Actinopolymorphaceae bacterium]